MTLDNRTFGRIVEKAKTLLRANITDWDDYRCRVSASELDESPLVRLDFQWDMGKPDTAAHVAVEYPREVWSDYVAAHDRDVTAEALAFEILWRFGTYYGSDPYDGDLQGIGADRFIGDDQFCRIVRVATYKMVAGWYPAMRLSEIECRVLGREDDIDYVGLEASPGDLLTTVSYGASDVPYGFATSLDGAVRSDPSDLLVEPIVYELRENIYAYLQRRLGR